MAIIKFKSKIKTIGIMGSDVEHEYITVPVLTRSHCDMRAMRVHKRHGAFANSDMFPAMLAGSRAERFPTAKYTNLIRVSALDDSVTIDKSGFLVVVSIEV